MKGDDKKTPRRAPQTVRPGREQGAIADRDQWIARALAAAARHRKARDDSRS